MAYVQWKIFALIVIVSFVQVGHGACIYDDTSSGKVCFKIAGYTYKQYTLPCATSYLLNEEICFVFSV